MDSLNASILGRLNVCGAILLIQSFSSRHFSLGLSAVAFNLQLKSSTSCSCLPHGSNWKLRFAHGMANLADGVSI